MPRNALRYDLSHRPPLLMSRFSTLPPFSFNSSFFLFFSFLLRFLLFFHPWTRLLPTGTLLLVRFSRHLVMPFLLFFGFFCCLSCVPSASSSSLSAIMHPYIYTIRVNNERILFSIYWNVLLRKFHVSWIFYEFLLQMG